MVHSETCNKVFPPNSMVGEVWDLVGREEKKKGMHVGRPPRVLHLSWPLSPPSVVKGVSFKGLFEKAKKFSCSQLCFYLPGSQ